MNRRIMLGLLGGAGAMALAAPGFAQVGATDRGTTIDELVVTAQKREESLQDVPISITYVGGEQMERQRVDTIGELSLIAPSVQGGAIGTNLSIRGITTSGVGRSAEQAVSVVLDGVPGEGRTMITGLFDIDHVEVLNGPQGTLFGKNATAGVVNIITRAPVLNDFQASAHLSVGNYRSRTGRLTVNVPVADTAALRINLFHDGYGRIIYNVPTRQWSKDSETGIRARLRWEPTEDLSINLIGDYAKNYSNGILTSGVEFRAINTFRYIETNTPSAATNAANRALLNQLQAVCGIIPSPTNNIGCSETAGGDPDFAQKITKGLSGQIDYQMGGHTLTSITAYREAQFGKFNTQSAYQNDVDIRPTDFLGKSLVPYRVKIFNQEIRIASPQDQTVEYVAGAFYQHKNSYDHIDQTGGLGLPPPLVLRRVNDVYIKAWNAAAFGQVTYHASDRLRFTAGARYTHDEVKDRTVSSTPACDPSPIRVCIYSAGFSLFPIDVSLNYDNLSGRVGVEYDYSPDVMFYASAARGYKAGFANDQSSPGGVAANGQPLPPLAAIIVKPEYPTSFEVGMKGAFFDRRVIANVAVFHTRIKDYQTNISIPASGAPGSVPSFGQGNASYIITQGIDASIFGRVTDNLSFNLNMIYNKAYYSDDYTVPCASNYIVSPIVGCGPLVPGGPNAKRVGGDQISGVPKFRATLSGEYRRSLPGGLEAFLQADVNYRTGQSTLAGDPIFDVGPDARLGGRFGIGAADGKWTFSAWGRNLDRKFHTENPSRDFAAPGTILTNSFSLTTVRTMGISLDVRY